jgi:hypothetical protein
VILFVVAAAMGAVMAYSVLHKPHFQNRISLPVTQASVQPTDTPSPTPVIPKPEVTTQISPDGTKMLTMTATTNHDLSKTYDFVASDADGTNNQSVYSVTLSGGDSMSIPFNAWSPDDRYVFVSRNSASGTDALVMRADGTPLSGTNANFDVKTLFTARNTGNTYQETTGWASDTLLIVNTTTQDGSKGPSYWFEAPSGAIIELATRF